MEIRNESYEIQRQGQVQSRWDKNQTRIKFRRGSKNEYQINALELRGGSTTRDDASRHIQSHALFTNICRVSTATKDLTINLGKD